MYRRIMRCSHSCVLKPKKNKKKKNDIQLLSCSKNLHLKHENVSSVLPPDIFLFNRK